MASRIHTVFRCLGLSLLGVTICFTALWGALALLYAPSASSLTHYAAAAYALMSFGALVLFCLNRKRWLAFAVYAGLFCVVLLWWQSIHPSNQRNWQADVARLPMATLDGNQVLVKNIRNFSYSSEFDYTPAYYDQRFDVDKLEGIDLISVYWMGPDIAHVFLSFAFTDGKRLAISIETRKEKGEAYSTIKGFFRQYELYYVVADERDVIRLRTNYRKDPPEDVFVYRLRGKPENVRRLFLEYIRQINLLNTQAEFYNSLTTNCTTSIWLNTHANPDHLPFSFSMLATGRLPEHLYKLGLLEDKGLSFEALQKAAHVNARAQAADKVVDFSQRIRMPIDARN